MGTDRYQPLKKWRKEFHTNAIIQVLKRGLFCSYWSPSCRHNWSEEWFFLFSSSTTMIIINFLIVLLIARFSVHLCVYLLFRPFINHRAPTQSTSIQPFIVLSHTYITQGSEPTTSRRLLQMAGKQGPRAMGVGFHPVQFVHYL